MKPSTELEGNAWVLLMHLRGMTRRLRQLPDEKWDFAFTTPAPTPRIIALHTLQWLQCDRQHLTAASFADHKLLPEPGPTPEAICAALDEEADEWEKLFADLATADLDRVVRQFDGEQSEMNVRCYVGHMVQNVIYKAGQFSTIYYALGLDGKGPYEAPWPNEIYKEVWAIREKAPV